LLIDASALISAVSRGHPRETPLPLGTNRRRAATRAALTTVLLLAGIGLVPAAAVATSAPTPVVIDDFSGNTAGPRTVTTLPLPNTSTTPAGTFSQSGGVATMTMNGNGNGIGGVQLSYALPHLDLTSNGSNTQFFLAFPQITRTGTDPTAANISITMTGGGITGTYGTAVGSTTNFNIVLNFSCATNPVCFSPEPVFTDVTNVTVTITYPQSHDTSGSSTTVVLDSINTTPTGGAIPDPATPTITAPADPTYAAAGSTLSFPVQFTSGGQPVAVYSTTTGGALGHGDVTVGGTAPGASTYTVTGSGSSYTVKVGPLTGDGTVSVALAAGAAQDAWAQPTGAASASVHFVVPVPPSTSATPPEAQVGVPYSFQFTSGGNPPATYTAGGALPAGLSLASDGALTGTPLAGSGGAYAIDVTAANVAGTATYPGPFVVREAPALPASDHADLVVGQPGSVTIATTAGYPVPSFPAVTGLPDGLSLTDNGDGTATISGTPTAAAAGVTQVAVHAVNWADAVEQLTIEVAEAPAVTSASTATFATGAPGSFTVTTTGYPRPALGVTGTVPAGLTFVDNGDGTATLSGTPTAGGQASLTIHAVNAQGSVTSGLTVDVQRAPVFTNASSAIFVVGTAGTFTVAAPGVPDPVLSLSGTLPAGLTFVDNGDGTATIAGTPQAAAAGDHQVVVSATSGTLPAVDQTLTLKVKQVPAFTSTASATFRVGVAGRFTVMAVGVPTPSLALSGTLPPGLTFVDNGDGTATIAGTPAAGASGSYSVAVNATNDLTDPVQTLVVVVDPAASSVPAAGASGAGASGGAAATDGTLAITGLDTAPLVALSLALVVVGVVVAGAARRRRA